MCGVRQASRNDNYLIAIYDLTFNPITFDFAYFMASAELFAKKHCMTQFEVIIVRKQQVSAAVDNIYEVAVDSDSSEWRLNNIVLPLISLYPSCIGHAVVTTFSDIKVDLKNNTIYPEFYSKNYRPCFSYNDFYSLASTYSLSGLRASAQGLKYVRSWRKENNLTGNIVTITIRNYKYDTTRNSNIDEWVKFAHLIKSAGYVPVFVPDTDSCFENDKRVDGLIVFREPCWNLGLRIALYEESYLNFFKSSGTASLAQLNMKVRYICMSMAVAGSLQATEDIWKIRGIEVGQRKFSFSKDYQICSWSEDQLNNICAEFYAFIENDTGISPSSAFL